MNEMFSLEELKGKVFEVFKQMCISHLQEDLYHVQESESYDELAKHLYGVYRIFAGHAKLAYDYSKNKDDVKACWQELEEMIRLMENDDTWRGKED